VVRVAWWVWRGAWCVVRGAWCVVCARRVHGMCTACARRVRGGGLVLRGHSK